MHHRPLFRKLGKKSTTKGNAHRREYKFCCTSTIESILHSTVLSDTTSADALSCRGKAPPPPPFDGGDDDLSINIQTQVGHHPYRRAPRPPRARRRAAHPGSSRSAELRRRWASCGCCAPRWAAWPSQHPLLPSPRLDTCVPPLTSVSLPALAHPRRTLAGTKHLRRDHPDRPRSHFLTNNHHHERKCPRSAR